MRSKLTAGCAALLIAAGGATGVAIASEQQPAAEPETEFAEIVVPTGLPNGNHAVHADEPGDAPTLVKSPFLRNE